MAAKLTDNLGYWLVLLLTMLKHYCARCKIQASLVLTRWPVLSPPAWHKLRLCCTRPLAAKLTDKKTLKVFLFNGNHSIYLLLAAVSLLWNVDVQHAVFHLCLNLVGVGIVG